MSSGHQPVRDGGRVPAVGRAPGGVATGHPLRRTASATAPGGHRVEADDITTWVGQAGFTVALRGGHDGAVRFVPGTRRVGLVVAHDLGPGSPVADDLAVRAPSASTSVWGHADGRVLVRAVFSPPALLLRADPGQPVTLVPDVPGDPGEALLRPGDRLVVLTAAAFDLAPRVVARLVRGGGGTDREGLDELRAVSDATLLHRLLRHAPLAGGAVLSRATTSTAPSPHPPRST